MRELPTAFRQAMEELLGSEYASFIESYEDVSTSGIRFNTLKASDDDIRHITDILGAKDRVPWCDIGYYLPEGSRPGLLPHYAAGLYYIQEPSAMAPVELLPALPSDAVLDLCAAPGGKATRLAAKSGVLIANDISASRCRGLVHNIELAGLYNAGVTACSPAELSAVFPETFDCILVDAPCSGEGMFRRDPALITSWEERGPGYYHELQGEILDEAYVCLRPGGYLLYSTCTFSQLEDEETVLSFLDRFRDMRSVPLPVPEEWCFEKGKDGLDDALRLYPHRLRGEGHFMVLLKKDGSGKARPESSGESVIRSADKVLCIPEGSEDILLKEGIRFMRRGLMAGEYDRRGAFRPAHSLALAARNIADKEIFSFPLPDGTSFEANILRLDEEDERVMRYLRGETLEVPSDMKGECLVCMGTHTLGFGRSGGGRLKNDLPKGYVLG